MISTTATVAGILKHKNKVLVLTGAGLSTASGIPDFRSKTGVYNQNPKLNGETILSRDYFFRKPQKFYQFLREALYYPDAKPNRGHEILAKWEKEGWLVHIVTQNIDGLHQEAGSERVIEFHGTMKTATCHNPHCKKQYTIDELLSREGDKFYYCGCTEDPNRCVIKPDFVLFDEQGFWLSGNPFYHVQCLAYDADAILILGTSLKVRPFCTIPDFRNNDTKTPIIIINNDETHLDNKENVFVVRDDISKTLEEIDKLIR